MVRSTGETHSHKWIKTFFMYLEAKSWAFTFLISSLPRRWHFVWEERWIPRKHPWCLAGEINRNFYTFPHLNVHIFFDHLKNYSLFRASSIASLDSFDQHSIPDGYSSCDFRWACHYHFISETMLNIYRTGTFPHCRLKLSWNFLFVFFVQSNWICFPTWLYFLRKVCLLTAQAFYRFF